MSTTTSPISRLKSDHSSHTHILSQSKYNPASPHIRPRLFSECVDDKQLGNQYNTSHNDVSIDIELEYNTETTPLNSNKHTAVHNRIHPKYSPSQKSHIPDGPFSQGHSRHNTHLPITLTPNTQHKRLSSNLIDFFTPTTRQRTIELRRPSILRDITNADGTNYSQHNTYNISNSPSNQCPHNTSTAAFLSRHIDDLSLNDISNASRVYRDRQLTQLNQKLPQINKLINPFNVDETRQFIKSLSAALFSSALPLNVIEFYVVLAAIRLGEQNVNVISVSNSMFLRFGDDSTAHLVQPPYVTYSLSKMVDLCHITEYILTGTLDVCEGLLQLNSIVQRDSAWNKYTIIPSLGLMGCCSALYWNGGGAEMLTAMTSGTLIGLLQCTAPLNLMLIRGHDLISGFIAASVAVIVNAYITPIYIISSVFAGILYCLPGLRATLAMNDLSTGNTVTGSAKLMSAILTCIQLGIGVQAGLTLNKLCGNLPLHLSNTISSPQPLWKMEFVVLINGLLTIVTMDGKSSHCMQLCGGSMVAYTLSTVISGYVGNTFAAWIAAFATGVIGNIYGRLTSNPAIEYWLFSILPLVPGSIGVNSVLAGNNATTFSLFATMLGIAIAIVTGLFTANFALPPRRMM